MYPAGSVGIDKPALRGTLKAFGSENYMINGEGAVDVFGVELLQGRSGSLKFIVNDSAIIFFSASKQHRDIKMHGLTYEDDYRGNALAGTVTAERVEIRFHSQFSDERVRNIWSRVLVIPGVASTGLSTVYYQGRHIA